MIRYVTINSVRIERIHTSALVGQNKQIKHLMTQAPTLKQNKAVKTTFLEEENWDARLGFLMHDVSRLRRSVFDEFIHFRILFYNCKLISSPAGQFITNTACTSKQIQGIKYSYIKIVLQNIEQALLGNISGRPGMRHVCWRSNFSATVRSAYYSHKAKSIKWLKYCFGISENPLVI